MLFYEETKAHGNILKVLIDLGPQMYWPRNSIDKQVDFRLQVVDLLFVKYKLDISHETRASNGVKRQSFYELLKEK